MFCQPPLKRPFSLADVVLVHYPTEVCDGILVFGGLQPLLDGVTGDRLGCNVSFPQFSAYGLSHHTNTGQSGVPSGPDFLVRTRMQLFNLATLSVSHPISVPRNVEHLINEKRKIKRKNFVLVNIKYLPKSAVVTLNSFCFTFLNCKY